jgi:thiol-disulfide isomerase/thioredoxin
VSPPKKPKGYTPPKGAPTPARASRAKASDRSMWWLGLGLVIVVSLVVGVAVLTSGNDEGSTEETAWDLPTLDNGDDPNGTGRVQLANYAGTPVVLNFYASWCTSCEAELPRFAAADDNTTDEVAFVFVNSNETGRHEPMAERGGIDGRTLVSDINGSAGNGLYQNLGGSGGMPMTAFYDADGNVVHVDRGELSTSSLKQRMEELFGLSVSI